MGGGGLYLGKPACGRLRGICNGRRFYRFINTRTAAAVLPRWLRSAGMGVKHKAHFEGAGRHGRGLVASRLALGLSDRGVVQQHVLVPR